ncbi:xylulokinase [Tamaricihabitans halophyticus]|uniref:Xylulokinase n=1 Tax=Tamaricihabitans halophyticus TaxID=1262583 RepID=A0A4R2QGV5_9PSEU|nr:xylulokinase [Tamaricihabitans halophyticus]
MAGYLGIDIGSTATKAVAFAPDGTPIRGASVDYAISRPAADRAEQDARDWRNAAEECVAELARHTDLGSVRGIGVTGQVDTHVLVDEAGEPTAPALLWQDVRTSAVVESLNARLGPHGRAKGWASSQPIDASNPVPRALWLAEHEPAAWRRARWLLLPKDFINGWLTGEFASDPLASFKIANGAGYLPGIAEAPGLAERLPSLYEPDHPVGRLRRDWHGVRAGTPVATGTMDAYCDVLGSGLRQAGDTLVILGTTAVVATVGIGGTDGADVVTFAPYRGRQVHAAPTQSGGDSLRWWATATGHEVAGVLGAAGTAEPGAGGVIFAPHLLGERAPLWDTEVRAWFTGMHASTGFAELSRAVLEGVGYSVRELLDAVEAAAGARAERLVISGGGSRDPLWCQIIADITGRPARRTRNTDTAVLGAAVLAASADTGTDPWARAAELTQYDADYQPDRTVRTRYDQLYELYRSSYHALREVHGRLARLSS